MIFRLLEVIPIIRCLRWVWQSTESALFEFVCFHVIKTLMSINVPEQLNELQPQHDFLNEHLSMTQQLVLMSFLHDRLVQVINKLYLVLSLTATSVEDRASRRSFAICLFQMNILFSPLVVTFIVLSSLVSAPMLSFFTLPVFFLTFPRPLRFWPGPVGGTSAPSADTVYYQQVFITF